MHWWGSNQTERSIFSLELDVIPKLVFRWLESAGHLSVVSVQTTAVSVVAKTVSVTGISKTVSVSMAVVSVVGIGISLGLSSGSWLSISRPLAVVAKTVSVAPVSKTMVAQAVVAVVGIGISLGLGVGQSHGNKASKNEKLHIGCSFTEC